MMDDVQKNPNLLDDAYTFAEHILSKKPKLTDSDVGHDSDNKENIVKQENLVLTTDGFLETVFEQPITNSSTAALSVDEEHGEIKDSKQRAVCYIYSEDYIEWCDRYGKVKMRAGLTHSLIESYDLLTCMRLIPPRCATEMEILMFHSSDYVEALQKISSSDDPEKYDDYAEQFGLGYDCPAEEGVYDYASLVAGASITAARCLNSGECDVAINWPGGWHHAKRDEAAGFCYFNDIVLAILTLREKYDKVLYIDLDLHHGDGTGSLKDVGVLKGKYFAANVPLKDGITDRQYIQVFNDVSEVVLSAFKPDAIVCQCGADGMIGDPMASFNLTPDAMSACIRHVLAWNLPTLVLGGGGYNKANTARCWTRVTGDILKKHLANDIPEHKYFTLYGPDYELCLTPGNRCNDNIQPDITHIVDTIKENLENLAYR